MSDITVLISTSPIPSNPSTAIIGATIGSISTELPDADIIIMADGTEQPNDAYQRHLTAIKRRWPGILRQFENHQHQSGMLKPTLAEVETPLIYYLEHDWVTLPNVPWRELSNLIFSGEFNSIKLHAQPRISPYYEHLMMERLIYQDGAASDRYQDNRAGVAIPIIRSRQWSQNPHLASTQFYREKILPLCRGKCDFIENIIHGIIANSPWEEFKTGIYNPVDGDMFRVSHLDGRGTP